MKTRLDNSAFVSLDLLVAVILVLVVLMLALQIIPALNPPVPETNMKQVLAATRASDMLIGDQGWRANWEESWNNTDYSNVSRIGFALAESQQNILDENKVSASRKGLMYPHNDTPANWWNNSWLFRQQISITNNNKTLALYDNYSVSITLDTASLIAKEKMLANGNDLRITYLNDTSEVEIDRVNETDFESASTQIWFRTQKPIPNGTTDNNYSIYYGNPKAGEPPANKSKVYLLWEPFDNTNNWTRWTNGEALPDVSGLNGIINVSNDPSNTFIAYRSDTGSNLNSSPKIRKWYKTSWGPEIEMPSAGSPMRWIRTAYSPLPARYYEKIVVTLSDDGWLDAYVWNGSAWIVKNNLGEVRYPDSPGFDLAYEKTSGRAILVYGINSTNTSRDLAYKIWDGTQWSIEQYIDDPGYSNLEGWTKYKPITIIGSNTTQTNYSILINITYDSDMQSNFSDIRFTLSDGVTQLNHWRESYEANKSAIFWVKVPYIPAYSNTTDILMQYGNSTVSNASNGNATFEFFDDFNNATLNLSKWIVADGTPIVKDGYAKLSNGSLTEDAIMGKSDFGTNYSFRGKVKIVAQADWWAFGPMDPFNAWTDYAVWGKDSTGTRKNPNVEWYPYVSVLDEAVYDIVRNSSTSVIFKKNGTDQRIHNISPIVALRPYFEAHPLDEIWIDWVLIRKYTYPEPTPIIGDEQTKHYSWISLASSPISGANDIAMIARRYQNNIQAWIWDGSSWSTPWELETNASSAAKDITAVAFEQVSGDAMFVWADSQFMQSRKWNGTSWGPEHNVSIGKDISFISLKPDNSSNDLMATIVDDGRNLSTVYWNGTSWGSPIEHDASIDTNTTRSADFDWEPGGGKGLLVWGNGSGNLRYKTFTSGIWSGASTIPAAGTHPWVQLRSNPVNGSMKILGVMLNNTNALGALSWNGITLTNLGDAAFTQDSAATAYESFDIGFIIAYSDLNADAGIYHNNFSLNNSEGFLIKQRSRSNSSGGDHAFAYWLANISDTSGTPRISSAYFARDGVTAYLSKRDGSLLQDLNISLFSLQNQSEWYSYEVFRKGDGGMKIVRNGSQLIPPSGWVYNTNLAGRNLSIGRWGNGSSEYDWLLVRKYLDPEPSTSLDLVDKWMPSSLPWWEYPAGSPSEEGKKNTSRALGLSGYNFYMQLRPLNESLFNEVRANYNITTNVPDAGASLVERYVAIRDREALVDAGGKTAWYRLILWVW